MDLLSAVRLWIRAVPSSCPKTAISSPTCGTCGKERALDSMMRGTACAPLPPFPCTGAPGSFAAGAGSSTPAWFVACSSRSGGSFVAGPPGTVGVPFADVWCSDTSAICSAGAPGSASKDTPVADSWSGASSKKCTRAGSVCRTSLPELLCVANKWAARCVSMERKQSL
eukprot:6492686-Amphidinium_carterae.4